MTRSPGLTPSPIPALPLAPSAVDPSAVPPLPVPVPSVVRAVPLSAVPEDGDVRGRLDRLVGRQAGVVSRGQAVGVGLEPREVDRHVARRRWRPVHPRVYLVGGWPPTDEARVRAAALWAGDGAVVVGAAALWWHGLAARPPRTVAVAVPRRCPAPRAGVAAHRRVLPPRDLVDVRGLTVPVRPLALLDAAVEAGAGGAALLRRSLGDDVGLAQLHAVAARAAGPASALRLIRSLVGVTSAPPPHRAEWRASRNRYS